jgi:transcription initiation factor IIE alpha subunit
MAFIGLDRGIVNHWIYKDAEYFKVWFEMLYRARFALEPSRELHGDEIVTVHHGEFIFGRKGWSERLGVSEQRLRTLIKKLRDDEMIEVVSEHRKCTVYRITNYAKFNQQSNQQKDQAVQGVSGDSNQQSNQHLTTSQPATNQHLTTKEQGNKETKKQSNLKPIEYFQKYTSNLELINALMDFVKMRKEIKKPISTERMINILLSNLGKLASDDKTKIDILDQAIFHKWQTVYALKDDFKSNRYDRPLTKQEQNKSVLQRHMQEDGVIDNDGEASDPAIGSLFNSLPHHDDDR